MTQGKVGQRVALENQVRALAVVFGVRLPRALTAAFIDQALKASGGVAGLSAAGTDCGAHRGLRRPAGEDPAVRGRQRHADPLQGPAQAQGRGLRDRQAITMRKARREELRSVPQHRMHDDCEATPQSDAKA